MAGYKLERGDGIKTVSPKSKAAKDKDDKAERRDNSKPKKAEKSESNAMEAHEHMSVSIRPIENGYLMSQSCSGPKGEYSHKETFHPKRPKITMPNASSNRMSRDKD